MQAMEECKQAGLLEVAGDLSLYQRLQRNDTLQDFKLEAHLCSTLCRLSKGLRKQYSPLLMQLPRTKT